MANGQLVIVSSVVGHIVITLGGASEIDFFILLLWLNEYLVMADPVPEI